jgi:hypothetical protein
MGILFTLIVVYSPRRFFARLNSDWQDRKDEGDDPFMMKPDTVSLFALILVVGAMSVVGTLAL